MSERRSFIAPPEMMNGSTSGRTSSHISAVVMRIGQIEKVEYAVTAVQPPRGFFVEQCSEEPVFGVKHQLVQCALRPGAARGAVLAQRQLKEGVQLDRGAAALRVLDDLAAGADVAGAAQVTH